MFGTPDFGALGGVTMAEAAENMRRACGGEPDPLDPREEMRDWDRRFESHAHAAARKIRAQQEAVKQADRDLE
ncbi:MAG TPA: hypothetical protein VN894_12690, partial [Polyangiaceae bacterium]|nr:hypothetical protein [Polyangiaceae bacterium]